jgi:hypothetical protein
MPKVPIKHCLPTIHYPLETPAMGDRLQIAQFYNRTKIGHPDKIVKLCNYQERNLRVA